MIVVAARGPEQGLHYSDYSNGLLVSKPLPHVWEESCVVLFMGYRNI